ncbi:hypothetical protein [Cellulomonas sp. PhB150]|uniref:ApeA N-terminal domain 1-containing protein n=1 Tax=Cellulomonas sp. PhB150 TaxID=2485188 RepID=UPI000FBB3F7B|nr:hypothetical protein [Cellulomonas sp. PhB150]ROS21799.1 hypothetical protein EDF34_3443 [Cellulomonas sp. PhB150]
MAQNDLAPGQSRVGYAWDPKIVDPYPAMLRDIDGRIELVLPYDRGDQRLRRRYIGDLVHWGDDPDLVKFDYALPDRFWFYDAYGFVCLVGVKSRSGSIVGAQSNLSECRLTIRYAVFTGDPSVDYSSVNGLAVWTEGLGHWYGERSVTTSLDPPRPSRSPDVTITVKAASVTRLDRRLNLSVRAGVDWSVPGRAGLTSVQEIASTETVIARPRDWQSHLDMHYAVHELVELSAWSPIGVHRIRAMHARDPQRVLSGDIVGDRWADVRTYEVPATPSTDRRHDFHFEYGHIGAAGVRRWLRLRDEFRRGIAAMTFGMRHPGMSVDGRISDAGIGLEEIGYRILGRRAGHHAMLESIAREVRDLLPFDAAEWASASTGIYNDVKHADRRTPSVDEMVDSLRQDYRVFRIWVARRIGVPKNVISGRDWALDRI